MKTWTLVRTKPGAERPGKKSPIGRKPLSSESALQPETQEETVPNHPYASLSGAFAEEPLWDEFQTNIQEYRKSLNERDDAC